MTVCIFAMRKLFLVNQINWTQFKLMNLQKRRFNLQRFGTALSDGKIDWKEMLEMPKDYIKRANHYIHTTQNPALGRAEKYVPMYMNQMMQQASAQNPNYQMTDEEIFDTENYVREQLINRELQHAKKQQEAQIAYEENMLEMEQKKLETRLQTYTKELEQVEKAETQAIAQATAKFVFQG